MSEMKTIRIAVIEGDGIGPELIAQVEKIVAALNKRSNSKIELTKFPYGADYYLKTKITLPDEFVDQISKNFDAILLGPLGDPRITDMKHAKEIIFTLRNRLNLILNIHPVKLYRSWLSTIRDIEMKSIDILIIKESLESMMGVAENSYNTGKETEVVIQTSIYSRKNSQQFIKTALEYVKKKGRDKIWFTDRSAILPQSHLFWRSLIKNIASDYPDMQVSYIFFNLLIKDILEDPDEFRVILTPGNIGDILSVLTTTITGGYGLAYSIEINPDIIGVYRIMQSASTKYAGHNTTNPLCAVLALKNILEDLKLNVESDLLDRAIQNNFDNHWVTIDLGGILGTAEVCDYLCNFISNESI